MFLTEHYNEVYNAKINNQKTVPDDAFDLVGRSGLDLGDIVGVEFNLRT